MTLDELRRLDSPGLIVGQIGVFSAIESAKTIVRDVSSSPIHPWSPLIERVGCITRAQWE